jgi:hypothetical protein
MKERALTEDLSLDGKVILYWILGKYGGKVWTGCIWIRTMTSGGSFEPLGSIKDGELLN